MQIRMAHPTGPYLDQGLSRPGCGDRHILDREWLAKISDNEQLFSLSASVSSSLKNDHIDPPLLFDTARNW